MIKKVLFGLVAFLAVLAVLEGSSRLVEARYPAREAEQAAPPGWQSEFFRTFLEWHQADPELLWRFKAGLSNPLVRTNPQHLLGDEVRPAKPPGTLRILLLGDSSPVGLGLQNRRQAFGELLQRLLTVSLVDFDHVELVNAAVSGYTSEQIRRFLGLHGWQYHPDLVLLYCGNNDASISGPVSDSALLASQRLASLRRTLSHLALYRLMRSAWLNATGGLTSETTGLTVRVTADRFGRNLEDIARQCREHHCPLIIVKPPVPLLWPAGLQFKVFADLSGQDGRPAMTNEMSRLLSRHIKYCLPGNSPILAAGSKDPFTAAVFSSAFADSLEPRTAIALYREQLRTDSLNPVVWNNLGVSWWQSGEHDQADQCLRRAGEVFAAANRQDQTAVTQAAGSPFLYNVGINLLTCRGATARDSALAFSHLDSALQTDFLSLRIKRDYLTEIDRLADRGDVFILDLSEEFALPAGERLFVDHCHPTAEGHQLIAAALAKLIRTRIVL